MKALERSARFKLGKTSNDIARLLRSLVRDAYENVPYYRARFGEVGITPDTLRGAQDLPQLPVTTKTALLAGGLETYLHRGTNPARCYRTSTSGSQGIPLTITLSRAEALWRTFMLWRTMARYTRLLPPLTVADVGPMATHAGYGGAERTGLVHLLRLPATWPVQEQLAVLTSRRLAVVEGYPTSLTLLAEALEQHGGMPYRPRLVMTRGEVLHAETRAQLERVFGCQVADLYNCEEVGNVAWSCPHDSRRWHINTDTCIVEIVDADGAPLPPDTEGRVLLTSLFGRAMPFLRYEIGDRAALALPALCSCGVVGPTLTNLSGRDDDFLLLPDGRRISPRLAATTVFNALKTGTSHTQAQPMHQFQIVQQGDARLILRVVLGDAAGRQIAQQAADALAALGLPCDVEEVAAIPFAPSGKLKKVLALP